MVTLSLSDCVEALDAELVGDDITIHGVSIDTRTLSAGMLYVAIAGDRFDGHDFVAEAENAGACALLVHADVASHLPRLIVADTRIALGALARLWAARHVVQTIGITGSNGKTTVKEIVAAILGQLGPVLATRGNLNNDIGVPLTLFELTDAHCYAVIEMGASAPGEIATLAAIACPDVGVISNIGPAHLDGFGSLAGVAAAKSELFAALSPEGYAVINADDSHADTLRAAAAHCRRREFGYTGDVDVHGVAANDFTVESRGKRLQADLALVGEHNRRNALAAVAAVQCLDVQDDIIVAGLESVLAVPGRLERKRAAGGATVIDDSYNANPASTLAALTVLAEHTRRRHLVLGDMAELGAQAVALHEIVGATARANGVDALWTVGELAAHASQSWRASFAGETEGGKMPGGSFLDMDTLLAALLADVDAGDTVLVKGSRSARMERVVDGLVNGLVNGLVDSQVTEAGG